METLEKVLARYDYGLPPSLIAQAPASPRDSARLLVADGSKREGKIDVFSNIGTYLPHPCLLILNDTKVIPARLELRKKTGGRLDALFTTVHGSPLKALLPGRVDTGDILTAPGGRKFSVQGKEGREWLLEPQFPLKEFHALLKRHGQAPLPPYIKHSPLTASQKRAQYQTVFAAHEGSIAAPTASLHFTKSLLSKLKRSGVTVATVTLHVHLGTFLPLSEEQLQSGQLHAEEFSISKKTCSALEKAKKEGVPIIAVGTTALRTLESAVDAGGQIIHPNGVTTLFIREGYRFRMTDGLITNFHVPKSSLLMLVSAFAGYDRIRHLYRKAIKAKMRFFSFGDAMFLRRAK